MRIYLSPRLRGAQGGAIGGAGVRAGDPAASVDRGAVTDAEDAPEGPRASTEGDPYRTGPYREPVERSLRERIEATIRRGGFLRCGAIALAVKDGVIERIFIRGMSLGSLGVASEDEIADRFGPPAGHEHALGWRLHHYPARRLVIAWDPREGRVEHVALGADPWTEPRLGAKDLLAELLHAYDALAPCGWAEPASGAARVRHQRIAALARTLGLGAVWNVVTGRFLEGAPDTGRRGVLEEIAAYSGFPQARQHPSSAVMLFTHLLAYRNDVDRVVRATAGWLECGDRVLLGMIAAQDRMGRQIEALMADVDRWLCTLLDPAGRTFGLRDLIAHHGWPDVDLHALEIDEL